MPEPKPTVEDLLNAIVADQPANIKKHFASSVSLMNGLVWGLYNYFGGSSVEWAIDEIRVCIRFAENALKTLPHGHGRTSEVISYAGKSDRCWSRIVLKHGRLLVMAFDEIPNHEFFHSKEYDLDFVSAHLDIEFEGSGFPDWNTLARIAENPPSVPNDAQSLIGPSLTILPDEDAAGQWGKRLNEPDRGKHREQRRCYVRDHTFLKWSGEGMGHAAIRDKWNAEYPDQAISLSNKESGRDVVKQGIKKARSERD